METILVCLLAGYGLWIVGYFYWEDRHRKKSAQRLSEKAPDMTAREADIVGKSLFRMKPKKPDISIPTPQAATKTETEKPIEKADIFAAETGKEPSARIPDEKLDEVFEHVEIPDVPLVDEEDEYLDLDEEEMLLGEAYQGMASGVSFEEIDRAAHIIKNPSSSLDDLRRAGEVLSELQGTEMLDRFNLGADSIMSKIKGVSDRYLIQYISRDGDDGADAAELQNIYDDQEGTADFDIAKYV